MRRSPPEFLRAAAPFALLVVGNVLYRLPGFINAAGVHSDAAIVGLQARHLLEGEYAPFLWGAGYQGSLDAVFVALVFALAGASPLALMVTPFLGHLLMSWFIWDLLRRRLTGWLAALVTLAVVFTPQAINGVALYAPRQWCLVAVFAAVWLLDGASTSNWPRARYALGSACAVFSIYFDLYGLQLLPALGVLMLLAGWDPPASRRTAWGRWALVAGGALVGGLLVWLPRTSALATSSNTALSLARVPHNFQLLWDSCLPWLLGYKVFVPGNDLYPQPWEPAWPVQWAQLAGGGSLLLFIFSGAGLFFVRRIPWSVRRLGLTGWVACATSLGGFLVSTAPADMWSTRYLAPIVWTAPLALAPLAYLMGPKRFGLLLAPYLAVAALGGWLSFGPYVNGLRPVQHARGAAEEEAKVGAFLREQGVRYAAGQYWLSYRLGFLWEENPVVIPLREQEDRYPPYREGFNGAKKVAYVFHPSEPRATVEEYEPILRQQAGKWERTQVAGFDLLLHERP